MTPQEIFLKATEIKSAEQRGRFLDESCSEDQALLEKVKALLDTWESESTLDNSGDAGVTVDRKVTPSADGQVGSTIGSYKLLQEIGEGGFGVVYMAEQFEPIRRKVALKIVKPISRMKAAPWIFAHYHNIYNFCLILMKLGENDQPTR